MVWLHITTMFLLILVLIACALPPFFIIRGALARGRQQWPPRPPALPFIGHLHLLGTLPHQSLYNLSHLYGPLMGLRLGRVPTIVASSPDMAKAILQTHDLAFASRPPSAAALHMFFDSANLGYSPYGPVFKRLRELLASAFLSPKCLESSRHIREEEARELASCVLQMAHKKPWEPVEIRKILLATTNNINFRMAMGKRVNEISKCVLGSKADLKSLVEEVMHLMGVFNVGDYIPWLAWLDLQGYVKRMKAIGQQVGAVMQAIIDERREAHIARAKGEEEVRQVEDLLDVMLLAASQNKQDHLISITDDNIKGVFMDIFVGGSDTSASTIEWALADLINNPKAMQKVQEELDTIVGKQRLVQDTDIPSLSYLGLVLKESMRLHPVAPLLIPHESTKGCEIGGYKIPSKTRAYVNTWAIGRNPTLWEMPLSFWPERFHKNNLSPLGQTVELFPFGSGRRKCPAYRLGLLSSHLMLATLVQGFDWSVMAQDNPKSNSHPHLLDMSERFEMTLVMAKPLRAFATPRLDLELYGGG